MHQSDIQPFFAKWGDLPQETYCRFIYHLVPDGDARTAAAALCCESSTAMWRRHGVSEDLHTAHGAKVIGCRPLASRPGAYEGEIAHPICNFGARLPNLLTAAAGEGAFYAPGIVTVKLMDISFPDTFLQRFDGPQFGLNGLRERLGVRDRPFFVGVVKPNLGLTSAYFAPVAEAAWVGGLDLCKDDEMQADAEWSPLADRVRAAAAARDRAVAATGERKGFIANITDEVACLSERLRAAETSGADVVMLNPIWTGLSAVRQVRTLATVPIMGHFVGAAVLSRQPDFGIAAPLLIKLMRLAGCDLIAIAGFGERMRSPKEEIMASIAACLEPMGPIRPALPIPGGSDWAGTLPTLFSTIGHADFGFIAGRGIFAHPMGPKAGAISLRQAWEAIRTGETLADVATSAPELAAALTAFGSP
ncbi:MAG: ribulose 1,5-bisphosphate carboxylase [Deltaproteobacteria bacterium]|nr:ribulose 1,5-bisphosphate carboxylase [Deltaproteobacteria bacterium]